MAKERKLNEKANMDEGIATDDNDIEKRVEIIDGKYVHLRSFQSLKDKYHQLEERSKERESLIEELEYWFIETDHMLFHIEDMIKEMRILKFEK